MAIQAPQPLGQALVNAGVLTQDRLDVAVKEQNRTGKRLGEVLVSLGFCKEEDVSRSVAGQAGVKMVDLEHRKPDAERNPAYRQGIRARQQAGSLIVGER